MGLAFPEAYGGQDLPWLVNTAAAEIWTAANLSFQICPLLTQGAIDAILHHGSRGPAAALRHQLISGEWTGAMCLTEPQAGSDLGALRTRAVRDGDRYRIFGTKIFITFGEHDLAENIVHLVLARLDGAPAGTGGISLFIVPKFLPDAGRRPRPAQRPALRLARAQAGHPSQPDLRHGLWRRRRCRGLPARRGKPRACAACSP